MMAVPVVARLVPLATRRVGSAMRSFRRPQICQWRGGARRSFTSSQSVWAKKYTEDHEWIELDSDGKTGTIGITEYAAQQLGDVVYVELPEVGLEVNKGDSMGAVESVKSASDIMTPVTGTITDHNKVLEEKPGHINKSPEAEAWIAKIELANVDELDGLKSREEYIKFTEESE